MLEQLQGEAKSPVIFPMEYRDILTEGIALQRPPEETSSISTVEDLEARIRELEDEVKQRSREFDKDIEAARVQAREEGRVEERDEQAIRVEAATQRLTATLAEFATERDRYLAQVEKEVVRLALAIAARILHREAQLDPLLLTGAVRVALGQLADRSDVRLIVPAEEHQLWSEMLRLMPNLPLRPELIADEALSAGECRIETQPGNIDLGVRSQLAEIERGFFDLLDKRQPASALRSRSEIAEGDGQQQSGIDSAGN